MLHRGPLGGPESVLSIPRLRRCGTGRGRPTGRSIQRYRSFAPRTLVAGPRCTIHNTGCTAVVHPGTRNGLTINDERFQHHTHHAHSTRGWPTPHRVPCSRLAVFESYVDVAQHSPGDATLRLSQEPLARRIPSVPGQPSRLRAGTRGARTVQDKGGVAGPAYAQLKRRWQTVSAGGRSQTAVRRATQESPLRPLRRTPLRTTCHPRRQSSWSV